MFAVTKEICKIQWRGKKLRHTRGVTVRFLYMNRKDSEIQLKAQLVNFSKYGEFSVMSAPYGVGYF